MTSALQALESLRQGNRRFVDGLRSIEVFLSQTKRGDFLAGQRPSAVVLGCSDSRVPVEIVFDQGLGDLFVIRVAGNVVAPSQIGSVEFAVERFGVELVVVMGHTHCGAVEACVEQLLRPRTLQSPNLRSIVDRVRPSVEELLTLDIKHDTDELIRHAIRANIRVAAHHLRHGSTALEELIAAERLLVVGAEYSLESGLVDFFDGLP